MICKYLLAVAAASFEDLPMRPIINFDNSPQEPHWIAVNDGVMGGRSSGGAALVDRQLQFSGELSLENNGGFSSIRSVGRNFDFSDVSELCLRVRGDGRRYQLRLATDASYRGIPVSFGAPFDTRAGEWIEVRVPLNSLQATVRGSVVKRALLDPAQVREIGLLIADQREGAFSLVVDWIAVQ